jgi:hypothetical protein
MANDAVAWSFSALVSSDRSVGKSYQMKSLVGRGIWRRATSGVGGKLFAF